MRALEKSAIIPLVKSLPAIAAIVTLLALSACATKTACGTCDKAVKTSCCKTKPAQ